MLIVNIRTFSVSFITMELSLHFL